MSASTGTAYDFVRIDIPCPSCGKDSMHLIRELVANDAVACIWCAASVDLQDRRAFINEAAERFKQIRFTRRPPT